MEIVLISPSFSEIRAARGTDLKDAIEAFKSSVWQQGWGADAKVMNDYGDWLVYERREDQSLEYWGQMNQH